MGNLRHVSLAVLCLGMAAPPVHARQGNYCASQPPPEGMVERCRSKTIVVPESEAALRFILTEWMRTCVSSDRAPGLVYEAESVDKVWDLVSDRPHQSVTIYPDYEPLTFTQNGRTCYGVVSVEFRTTKKPVVVEDGEPTVSPADPSDMVTSDMIKEAAAAAKRALNDSSARDNPGLAQFRGVLDGLERYGKDFNDTYYPVAPFAGGAASFNPDACDREFSGATGHYECLPADKAVKACERHLADDLVTAYNFDKLKGDRFRGMLEEKSADINRGFSYLYQLQSLDSSGATACPGLRDVIKPKIGALAQRGRTALYGYY